MTRQVKSKDTCFMDWDELRALRISEWIVKSLESDQRIQLKESAESLLKQIEQEIKKHFQAEKNLTEEVYQMMERLEREGHQFDRQKMFPILKKQLAKQKGLIL